jgi:protein-tyrosine phosphatase
MKRITPFLIVLSVGLLGCSSAKPPTKETADQKKTPKTTLADHHIPLEGQPNFRDLGGYKTTDGKTVKRGLVFRSGELPRLTDADVAKLDKLGIKTIVNFLAEKEIAAKGSDRLPEGVTEVFKPIDTSDGLAVHMIEARKTGDFTKVPPTINPKIHTLLAQKDAHDQYATLFKLLADGKSQPLVFHCSHGIHRTGTAAAFLLWTLGVPWDTIREDYMLSNDTRKEEVVKRRGQLRIAAAKHQGIAPDQVDMTNIDAFYILEPHYIDAARDEILKTHGSINAYLKNALKLTDQDIQNLKANLLE